MASLLHRSAAAGGGGGDDGEAPRAFPVVASQADAATREELDVRSIAGVYERMAEESYRELMRVTRGGLRDAGSRAAGPGVCV